tara:strand:- start:2973 stop:3662 length:690 start_codon:yes stop_codon:yes gene_type:complete
MKITIFKEITTEGVIASIEENSKKYHVGFYADMNNAPERKLVKESASEIGDIIKELEVARIKITKANTAAVNKEHKLILERLTLANAPFQTLIDEYTAQRKKILADEKYVVELRAAMVQKEDDHEMALLINKTFEYDKAEQLRVDAEEREIILQGAKEQAEECQRINHEEKTQKLINEEKARLANVEYVRGINRAIYKGFIDAGLIKEAATIATQTLIDNKITNVTINY